MALSFDMVSLVSEGCSTAAFRQSFTLWRSSNLTGGCSLLQLSIESLFWITGRTAFSVAWCKRVFTAQELAGDGQARLWL